MSENSSPFVAMQRLEIQLKSLARQIDPDLLDVKERQALSTLGRLSRDARLDIRDYELSETRAEQLENAREGHMRLKKLADNLQSVGFVFGAADMAELSAQIEQINSWLV